MYFEEQPLRTEILVLGGGGAAGMAAIRSAELGRKVILATKSSFPGGSTVVARGGWQAAVGHSDARDNPSLHVKDTLAAGFGINDPELVEVMANESVKVLEKLDRYGAIFARESNGRFAQKPIHGVTYARHIHNFDNTGKGIAKGLKEGIAQNKLTVLNHTLAIALFVSDGKICGALLYNSREGKIFPAAAKAVILATGGGSSIYEINDNLPGTTGDGYLLALNAGLKLRNMEMIEFQLCVCHPSSLMRFPPNSSAWVIRGGRLYNGIGERFMKRYDPVKMEDNSRAAINRAVALEISKCRGTPHSGVYLDLSGIPFEVIKEVGPTIYKAFKSRGIDLAYQPMELGQGAHSFLGGVLINARAETAIDGLFAAGEVTGGVHGANRLGGNQLSDALAFGHVAGVSAADWASRNRARALKKSHVRRKVDDFRSFVLAEKKKVEISLQETIKRIRHINTAAIGPIRNQKSLEECIHQLEMLKNMLPNVSIKSSQFKQGIKNKSEAMSMVMVGRAIAMSALCREESRGVHYREDFPKQNDNRFKGSVCVRLENDLKAFFRKIVD